MRNFQGIALKSCYLKTDFAIGSLLKSKVYSVKQVFVKFRKSVWGVFFSKYFLRQRY